MPAQDVLTVRISDAAHERYGHVGSVRRVMLEAALGNPEAYVPCDFDDGMCLLTAAQVEVEEPEA
jgi:hypothetical protein